MRSFHDPIIAWKDSIIMPSQFLEVLRVLKNEELVIRVDILQQLDDHVDPPQRARYIDCNARIVRIVV